MEKLLVTGDISLFHKFDVKAMKKMGHVKHCYLL